MPLYQIDESRRLLHIQHKTFQEVELKERQHLQALLRDNPSAISPDLLIIAEEFSNWTDSSRRIDLLALDRDANLVVIELKRVDDGSHMELQAIRYAAMVAPMDFDAVVESYQSLLRQQNADAEQARSEILRFLRTTEEPEISNTPRIVLISPSFSKEITTTVLWLNERGLNIRCMQARPYQLDGKLYIDIEQIIPLLSAESYLVSLGRKAMKAERQATSKRRENTIPILRDAGILLPNTRLLLIRTPRPNMQIPDDSAKRAVFLGDEGIRWNHDERVYTLTALCRRICEEYGGDLGAGTFAGPDYWAIEGDPMTLTQRAKALKSASGETEVLE